MQASVLELVLNPTMSKLEEDSRVATGKQPRGRKILPLISEFEKQKIIRCRDSDVPLLDDKNRLTADFCGVPTGSQLLRKAPVNKGESTKSKTMWVFAIFRDPSQAGQRCTTPFRQFSCSAPRDLESGLQYSLETSLADSEKETGKAAVLATWCNRVG